MPDTAVEEIQSIVESLGGTSTAETVVPALQDLQTAISQGGGTVADGSVTTAKLAIGAVTEDRLSSDLKSGWTEGVTSQIARFHELSILGASPMHMKAIATDATVAAILEQMGVGSDTRTPLQLILNMSELGDSRCTLVWVIGTTLDSGKMCYCADLQTGTITVFARGLVSTCSGTAAAGWSIASL